MNMKNGFSTLNRLLGKKSKSNSNLSKSTTNLSVTSSITNIEDSSQMQQNRITPLPVATSNAPFEQTFRITVLLPKDQLYVARLGARVYLHKLLELVCEDKQLDADKYEFRHPVDRSQVFSFDMTIGAVGLSEIRLCHKSDSYEPFNPDEIRKLHRTNILRDSVSSSEFSSRNSKHTIKTPSPYSSTNSLNSMDSTGMNSNYRHSTPKVIVHSAAPPVAPARKKRLAPRPPSQNSIPEKDVPPPAPITKPPSPEKAKSPKANGLQPIPRKDFHVSSPNLSQTLEQNALSVNDFHKSNLSMDCNGNTKGSPNNNSNTTVQQNGHHEEANGGVCLRRPTSLHILNQKETVEAGQCDGEVAVKNARNSYNSVQNLSTIGSPTLPEPSPRKKVVKSKKAAPAPPPRSLLSTAEVIEEQAQDSEDEETPPPLPTLEPPRPVALPRSSAGRSTPEPTELLTVNQQNVSKTMLNRSPTPEPRSTEESAITPDDGFDTQSKQADSGIGEALPPSPMPSSVQNSPTQCKSPFESSSDDDEMIKVYNLKLGKTIVKTLSDHKTFEDLTVLSTDESEMTEQARTPAETCSIQSETTSWSNFTIPAPPNFADTSGGEPLPDTPITPIIKERPPLDFASLSIEQAATSPVESPEHSPVTVVEEKKLSNSDIEDGFNGQKENHQILKAITEVNAFIKDDKSSQAIAQTNIIVSDGEHDKQLIVEQRSTVTEHVTPVTHHEPSITDPDGIGEQEAKVINEMDSIINSIETIIHQKPLFTTLDRLGVPEEDEEDEDVEDEEDLKETKIYKKRSSITLNTNILKHRRSITRSDSFHSTRQQQVEESTVRTENGLATRSSSFLSLAKFGSENHQSPPAEENLSRRRSSSELSIGESPSLQSVKVMKSILNSRKNSLTSQSSTEEPKTPPSACDSSTSAEQPSPKSNILRTQVAKQPEPKIYRYSGPPKINLSTWNDRPKVQVSIKNEGDYIFGGKNGGPSATTTATVNLVQQRNFRNSTPDPVNRVPFVRSVEYKKSTTVMAPFKEPVTPPPTPNIQTPSPPSTMPKPKFMLGGRMSNPSPVVRGFAQTTAPAPQSITSSTLPRSYGPSSVSLLRSTSVTQVDMKPKPVVQSNPPQPAFGQGTLRKTGLKEKILASQEDAPKPTPTVLTTPESAKIELKITKTHVPEKKFTPPQLHPVEYSSSKSVPAAPPPPPIIRAVVTKQNSNCAPHSLSVDPRDQLLSAIRGFKRDELKRI